LIAIYVVAPLPATKFSSAELVPELPQPDRRRSAERASAVFFIM
jgi:hypothetical protein